MPADREASDGKPRPRGRDVAHLLRQIQVLTQELRMLRLRGTKEPDLRAKERALEQLRWRLAVVARRAAVDDGGSSEARIGDERLPKLPIGIALESGYCAT